VRDWIGCCGVDIGNISDHLLQFTHLTGGGTARRALMQQFGFCALGLYGMNEIIVCLNML